MYRTDNPVAANNEQTQKPQQPTKKDCAGTTSSPGTIGNIADTFSRITHPLDLLAVNATFFVGGGGAVIAGGAAIGIGCAEPTQASH